MSTGTQHGSLSPERWARHSPGQRLLMIANEMNRASKLLGPADVGRRLTTYERVLALTDLSIQTAERRSVRKELLRWRDLIAVLYVAPQADPQGHAAAFRVLLQMHPETWRQLPYVTGAATTFRT